MYDLYQVQIDLDRLIQVAKKEMPDAQEFIEKTNKDIIFNSIKWE